MVEVCQFNKHLHLPNELQDWQIIDCLYTVRFNADHLQANNEPKEVDFLDPGMALLSFGIKAKFRLLFEHLLYPFIMRILMC
jgi:hypothetical protein